MAVRGHKWSASNKTTMDNTVRARQVGQLMCPTETVRYAGICVHAP